MNVQAKFQCVEIKHMMGNPDGSAEVRLIPVYGDGEGNKAWSKWTPQGELKMLITNPQAIAAFELGKSYILDITPAD